MTDLRERLAEWWSYDVGRTMELCQAEIARLTRDNAVWQRNNRDTFDAMCAMRNAINEILPMPSLESDLLQGPESSVFCASVAAAVVEHVSRLTASLEQQRHETGKRQSQADRWRHERDTETINRQHAEAERDAIAAAAFEAAVTKISLMMQDPWDEGTRTTAPQKCFLTERMNMGKQAAINALRALTPADAKAALDRMLRDARARGMREAADHHDEMAEEQDALSSKYRSGSNPWFAHVQTAKWHREQAAAILSRAKDMEAGNG